MVSSESEMLNNCKGGGRCLLGLPAPYALLPEARSLGNEARRAYEVEGCASSVEELKSSSALLKLASKGLKEALVGKLGELDSAGVLGDWVYVVEPAESSTSRDGIGEGGRGFVGGTNFFLADLGRRRKGSHSLDGLGDMGKGTSEVTGGKRSADVEDIVERGEGGATKAEERELAEDRLEAGTLGSSHRSTKSSSNETHNCVILAASSLEPAVMLRSNAGLVFASSA